MAWPVVGRLAQTLPNNNKKFEAKRTSSFRFEQRTSFYFDENGEKKKIKTGFCRNSTNCKKQDLEREGSVLEGNEEIFHYLIFFEK